MQTFKDTLIPYVTNIILFNPANIDFIIHQNGIENTVHGHID